jgi:hypothetical protein
MFLPELPADDAARAAREAYFQTINDVAVTEDYRLVGKIQKAVDCGIPRRALVGRNEPGVQNMHRQIRELLAPAEPVRLQRQ